MSIAVIGNGKIGSAIAKTLRSAVHHDVRHGDLIPGKDVIQLDVLDKAALRSFIDGTEAVIAATPYELVRPIAKTAAELGVAYFDLTEDRSCTDYVRSLESKSVLVPQCGLAPGFISIIATHLAGQFSKVHSIDMRVGALPKTANNEMKYCMTWSTAGLLNEYCHPSEMIVAGERCLGQPLDGLETITLDGVTYEAFNTSGGLGSMCETFEGKVESMSYKTMRYPGHCQLMRFLLKDLNLKKNLKTFVKMFDDEVPTTKEDVVVIYVKVTGINKDGKLEAKTFKRAIQPGWCGLTAIQSTTMCGILGVVETFLSGAKGWPRTSGFVKQEEIPFRSFADTQWGQHFMKD